MKIQIIRLTYESTIRIEYEVHYNSFERMYRLGNMDIIQVYYYKLRNKKILTIKRNKFTRKTRIYIDNNPIY